MKNYLVQFLAKVHNTNYGWTDRSQEGDLHSIYSEIQKVSYASFRHFLQGDWEYRLFHVEVSNVLDVFKFKFEKLYELGHSEPCNILYCGLDTQMLKPTDMFGKFDRMSMFNYTDPRSNRLFEHNFNCDVLYYPAGFDEQWWDYTLEQSKNLKVWEDEQNVYNHVMWNQCPGIQIQDMLAPALAYQGFMIGDVRDPNLERNNQWNGIDINQAHIIHWHSSRGAQNRLNLMTEVNKLLSIPYMDKTSQ